MRLSRLALAVAAALTVWTCDKATPVAPGDSGLEISANPTRIEIDGVSTITVIARKADGNPVNEGTEINFSTTLGEIVALARTNDRGVATTELRGGGEVGTAMVSASSGAAQAVTVEVQIGSLAGSINLQANPRKVDKTGGTINLVSVVRDDRGNKLRNAIVSFDSEVGLLDSQGGAISTDANGEARDRLEVDEFDLEGLTEGFFLVFAETTGGDAASGTLLLVAEEEITVGGFPGDVTLSLSASSIPSSGGSIGLTALVRTDGGKAARDAQVNFITQVGSLLSGGQLMPTDNQGQAFDTLTATQEDLTAFGQNAFTVTAETTGGGGELISDTRTVNIQSSGPTADFVFNRTTGTTVQFTNLTIGESPLEFQWDFQSDGQVDSTQKDPQFDYGSFGTFQCTLIATNAFGSDSVTRAVNVSGAAPQADFIFAPSANETFTQGVFFNSISTGEGTLVYSWDIDIGNDGFESLGISAAQSFTHEFDATTGDVAVRLTVGNAFGASSITKVINLPL